MKNALFALLFLVFHAFAQGNVQRSDVGNDNYIASRVKEIPAASKRMPVTNGTFEKILRGELMTFIDAYDNALKTLEQQKNDFEKHGIPLACLDDAIDAINRYALATEWKNLASRQTAVHRQARTCLELLKASMKEALNGNKSLIRDAIESEEEAWVREHPEAAAAFKVKQLEERVRKAESRAAAAESQAWAAESAAKQAEQRATEAEWKSQQATREAQEATRKANKAKAKTREFEMRQDQMGVGNGW